MGVGTRKLRERPLLWATVLAGLGAALWVGFGGRDESSPGPGTGAPPWVVEILADGSTRALGLRPGRSTLGEAFDLYGRRIEAALFLSTDGVLSAEAYYGEIVSGGISGRLVLSLELPQSTLEGIRDRAVNRRRLETGVVRFDVHPTDGDTLLGAPLELITFVPAANLEEATLVQRFGEPAERVSAADGDTVHLLYPARGLIITVSRRGREMLLYSHPQHFENVRVRLAGDGR